MTSEQTPSLQSLRVSKRLTPNRIPGESVVYDVIDEIGKDISWLQISEICPVNLNIKAMLRVRAKTPEQSSEYREMFRERRQLRGINRILVRELDLAHELAAEFKKTDVGMVGQSEIDYEANQPGIVGQDYTIGRSVYTQVLGILDSQENLIKYLG